MINYLDELAVVALVFLLVALCLSSRIPWQLRWVGVGGLLMRVVGAAAMLGIYFALYRGLADAVFYHKRGLRHAERMWAGDFRMFTEPAEWINGVLWGVQFVDLTTGLITTVLPGIFSAGLLFSLLSFGGLCLFAAAFARTYPHVPLWKYARWLAFFPSLWLWPSVIGKDALIMLGLGLLAYGYFRSGRIAWFPTASGLLLIFMIRPQVAAVVVFAVVLAELLGREQRWTFMRFAQGAVIIGLSVFVINAGLSLVRSHFQVGGVAEYVELRQERFDRGGSNVEVAGGGVTAIPKAFVLTLFRPFPWEAKNLMSLGSSLEIWFFWVVVLFRARRIAAALREWRATRFMAMGLPFVLVYAVVFGLVIVNLGIVARQRIFLFPFLFAMLEGSPKPAREPRRVPAGLASSPRLGPVARVPATQVLR